MQWQPTTNQTYNIYLTQDSKTKTNEISKSIKTEPIRWQIESELHCDKTRKCAVEC